jgi:hypothetical protein
MPLITWADELSVKVTQIYTTQEAYRTYQLTS